MNVFQQQIIDKLNEIMASLSTNSWIPNLICTLAGVFFGSLLTYWLSIIGRFRVYLVEFHYEYKKNEMGNIIRTENIKDASYCEVDIVIDFSNMKNHGVGIRNTIIEFIHNKELLLSFYAKDDETKQVRNYGIIYNEIEIINIESKKIERKKMKLHLNDKHLESLKKKPEVFFTYINKKNKKKKMKIGEIKEFC